MTEFLETRPNELEGLTSESQAADKDDLGNPDARVASLISRLGQRSLVLVGMMGAGKTSIGRRLAARLGFDFVDADAEIEAAAGLTVPEIFARHGETHFRDGERRVIARLLSERQLVLSRIQILALALMPSFLVWREGAIVEPWSVLQRFFF